VTLSITRIVIMELFFKIGPLKTCYVKSQGKIEEHC
jgi:hypothetical protein